MSEPLQVPDYGQQPHQIQVQHSSSNQDEYVSGSASGSVGGLNEKLNTDAIDIPSSDGSVIAQLTRCITSCVGNCFTPHQILVFLRLLKAVAFCTLVLNIFSVSMYILFVDILASDIVTAELGGWRDTVLRLYALLLSVMAILLELDIMNFVRHYSGLKGFIARSFLLYFISVITTTIPIPTTSDDDAAQINDDDFTIRLAAEIPNSAVIFQSVTSWILSLCAMAYLCLGVLCCDRFTSRAFISTTDPIVSTAIPQPSSLMQKNYSLSDNPERLQPQPFPNQV